MIGQASVFAARHLARPEVHRPARFDAAAIASALSEMKYFRLANREIT